MFLSSAIVFARHFSPDNLQEVVDLHLSDGVARGVDGTGFDAFLKDRDTEVQLISERALAGNYRFSPYRQKLLMKNATSPPRQVSIPTLRDRVALRALNNFLMEMFPNCKPQHAHPVISSVLQNVSSMTSSQSFIKLDIVSFYDAVNHKVLLKNLRRRIRTPHPLSMIERALRCPTGATVASASVNEVGIPQGLSISNLLSSIYLESIDQRFGSRLDVSYHRYVDDILCISECDKAKALAIDISTKLKRDKKLKCHPLGSGKSVITCASEGTSYLGYAIGNPTISVRVATEKKFTSSVMQVIFGSEIKDVDRAIWRVNLRITGCRISGSNVGWMFYFSQINDVKLLAKMDAQIRSAVTKKFGRKVVPRLKRLVKSYHQVKYHYKDSSYYPDFDKYSRSEMQGHLRLLAPDRFRNLDAKTDAEIARIFQSSVSREVRRMERDTLGSFS